MSDQDKMGQPIAPDPYDSTAEPVHGSDDTRVIRVPGGYAKRPENVRPQDLPERQTDRPRGAYVPAPTVRYEAGAAPVSWEQAPPRPFHNAGPPPDKGHNPGLTFLGMSGGILALVASAVILLFCVAPVVFCFGLGLVGAVTPTPSPSF